jgi:hypothetical protein
VRTTAFSGRKQERKFAEICIALIEFLIGIYRKNRRFLWDLKREHILRLTKASALNAADVSTPARAW